MTTFLLPGRTGCDSLQTPHKRRRKNTNEVVPDRNEVLQDLQLILVSLRE